MNTALVGAGRLYNKRSIRSKVPPLLGICGRFAVRGLGSVGRASPLHGEGQEFDSPSLQSFKDQGERAATQPLLAGAQTSGLFFWNLQIAVAGLRSNARLTPPHAPWAVRDGAPGIK